MALVAAPHSFLTAGPTVGAPPVPQEEAEEP